MGKRRNTAKTGDKALYKAREALENNATTKRKNALDDDPMYNDVDRFYNDREKEFLRLDGGSSSDDSDNDVDKVEGVMDLAAGGDDDSSDDDGSSDDENDQRIHKRMDQDNDGSEASQSSDEEIEVSSSDDDDDDDENDNNDGNIRAWGSKKSAYYQGDVNESSKGDGEDDAALEEMAAKEVQAARYKNMSEDDFLLSDDDDDDDKSNLDNKMKNVDSCSKESKGHSVKDNLLKLSVREQRKVIEKHHPEILPLLVHFTGIVENLQNQSTVATRAIFESEEENTAEVRRSYYFLLYYFWSDVGNIFPHP